MVRSFRRGAVAAVLALTLAPLAAACGAGHDAATLEVQPDSASVTAGVIKVQNVYVLTQSGGPATVTARLFNNGASAQTLQSVNLSGGGSATLTGPNGSGQVTVPAHGSILLGGQGNAAASFDSGSESLRDGDVQSAVFTFSGDGPVSVQANVSPAAGFLEPYGPSSTPTTAVTPAAPTTPATPTAPTTPAAPTATATPTA